MLHNPLPKIVGQHKLYPMFKDRRTELIIPVGKHMIVKRLDLGGVGEEELNIIKHCLKFSVN